MTAEEHRARTIVAAMLAHEFPGAEALREQLAVARVERHETGCAIHVDRTRAAPADLPDGAAPVDAGGHGSLWIMLHLHEGYLDDLELVYGREFPDPATVTVRGT